MGKNDAKRNGLVDPSQTYSDMNEDDLYGLWVAYYPAGSGPLGVMKTVCGLIEEIARMKGYNPSLWHRQ